MSVMEHISAARAVDPEDALSPGTTLLNAQYRIERYLSAGGFGITYLARDSLDRPVVIKECFPEAVCSRRKKTVCARSRAYQGDFRSFVSLFVREAQSLAKLRHPNVVGVHQVFEDNETAYMALELIEGEDLLSVIEGGAAPLPPATVSDILLKILDAVTLIHAQDMLHRDISPDNILIDRSGRPVLIDFGAAREEASKKSRALSSVLVVKDGYSPQEFYFGGSRQGPFSDIYALGATFYHLIAGEAPPHSQTRLAEIAGNNPDPCKPLVGRFPDYPNAVLASIDKAMNVFPKNRIQTAAEWSSWILDDAPARQDPVQAKENEKSIKALLSTMPRARQVPNKTPNPAYTPPADTVYRVDFSDLKKGGVPKPQPAEDVPEVRVASIEDTPQRRVRKPALRLAASFGLIAGGVLIFGPPTETLLADLQNAIAVQIDQLSLPPVLKGPT